MTARTAEVIISASPEKAKTLAAFGKAVINAKSNTPDPKIKTMRI